MKEQKKTNPNIYQIYNFISLLNDSGVSFDYIFSEDLNSIELIFDIDWECNYEK